MTSNEFVKSEKRPTYEFLSDSGIFFLSSYRINVTSCNLCASAKVKGHIEVKKENTSFGKLVKPFQIW